MYRKTEVDGSCPAFPCQKERGEKKTNREHSNVSTRYLFFGGLSVWLITYSLLLDGWLAAFRGVEATYFMEYDYSQSLKREKETVVPPYPIKKTRSSSATCPVRQSEAAQQLPLWSYQPLFTLRRSFHLTHQHKQHIFTTPPLNFYNN